MALLLLLSSLLAPGLASAQAGPELRSATGQTIGSLDTDLLALVGAGRPDPDTARQASGRGALYFPETGFAVDEPRFVDYFTRRGQAPTFGFPISRTIRFQGLTTQFFQRIVIQLLPDGSVQPLNLLDPGLLSYTRINGSTFPAPNERLAALAPTPGLPGYPREVLEFIRRNAPDTFEGEPVKFFTTFNTTVSPEVAFGRGGGDVSLLPLINLEIWGVPTSLPSRDPSNNGFIYQRFQRGIMHYDAVCKCTQGLLLADYFKAILTGENLPPDLAAQASASPFLRQYAPDRPTGLRQPTALPGTDLTSAFTRQSPPSTVAQSPAVSASSVSTTAPTAFRTRIRLGEGVSKSIDALEEAKLIDPLQTILDSDTDIAFGPLPENVHARYSRIGGGGASAIRSIVVSSRWAQSDPKAIATLIVHEARHLADDLAGVDPRSLDGCFQFEVRAFKEQVVAWETFYGIKGKAQPKDELDSELNAWQSVERRGPGEIEKRVRQLYAKACSQPGPRPH